MSVQSEIDRIITAVGNAYSKVSEKGGTVPASQTVANLATAIDSIPAGGTPSLQSKSVTITSNGTIDVIPDSGYDAMTKVTVTTNVSGGGGNGITISVDNYSTANINVKSSAGDSKLIKSGGLAYFDKLSTGSKLEILSAKYDSPISFFLENGYIPDTEVQIEEYGYEIMNAAEEFMNATVRVICNSYGFIYPDTINICFDKSSGRPAIIIM